MKIIFKIGLISLLGLFAGSAFSQNFDDNYTTLSAPVALAQNKDKDVVIEFFSYGCPHCYDFNSMLNEWEKSHPKVEVRKSPVIFGRSGWEVLAKAYYIAQVYNKEYELSSKIFIAIHQKQENLYTEDNLRSFFEKNGISNTEFDNVYNSAGMDKVLQNDKKLYLAAHISGVPALLVNGKYLVDPTKAKGLNNMLLTVDYLLKKKSK